MQITTFPTITIQLYLWISAAAAATIGASTSTTFRTNKQRGSASKINSAHAPTCHFNLLIFPLGQAWLHWRSADRAGQQVLIFNFKKQNVGFVSPYFPPKMATKLQINLWMEIHLNFADNLCNVLCLEERPPELKLLLESRVATLQLFWYLVSLLILKIKGLHRFKVFFLKTKVKKTRKPCWDGNHFLFGKTVGKPTENIGTKSRVSLMPKVFSCP